jgi:hypothetical protein
VLLPAVRKADPDTLIITDGFSCFEQIDDLAGREALHIAEVLQMAIREERRRSGNTTEEERSGSRVPVGVLVGAGAILAGAALYFAIERNSKPTAIGKRKKKRVVFEDLERVRHG